MENNEILQQLKEIKNLTMLQSKEMLSVREAALLMDMSVATVRKMAEERLIPFSKPFGKMIYFSKTDIVNILKRNTIPSIENLIQGKI